MNSSDHDNHRTFDAGFAALYSENGSVARAIMEWRHRVVMLYVITLGATGSSWLWLYDHYRSALPFVCYAVAVMMTVLGVMDDTNATILKACYRVGAEIEGTVLAMNGAIYSASLLSKLAVFG